MCAEVWRSAGQDRLDRFHELLDSREVTKSREAANVLVGALAALVDDATWDEALAQVEQVTL